MVQLTDVAGEPSELCHVLKKVRLGYVRLGYGDQLERNICVLNIVFLIKR